MRKEELEMAERLVRIFENVILSEEQSIQRGYFSDLSIAEMHTLDAIGPYDARTMTETASLLGITVGTLTISINRLVKKGYVARNRDTNDRRIVRISLTKQGKLACRMHGKFHRILARHILEPYNDQEQELLFGMVDEIDKYLQQQVNLYSKSESVRKTAKEVAETTRRREDNV